MLSTKTDVLVLFSALLLACNGGEDPTDPPIDAEAHWLGAPVVFSSAEAGGALLGTSDGYTEVMGVYDRGIRIGTTDATTEEDFLAFAGTKAIDWEPGWQEDWGRQVAQLEEALEGLTLDVEGPIHLVATSDDFEFGFPHTRGMGIVLPRSVLIGFPPAARRNLLAHELFHLLSRDDEQTRDAMYALLGFDRVDPIAIPTEFEDRVLSNPDAYTLEHAAELQGPEGTLLGAPFLYGLQPLEQSLGLPGLNVEVLIVDADSGDVFEAAETDYSATVSINTAYDLHPEEALADNFSILLEQRAGRQGAVGGQDLVDAMESVLSE